MTLRAYRPDEPTNGNDQNAMGNDWQDTLLDRPASNRQSSLHVAYGSAPKSKVWLLTGIFAVAAILVTGYFVMQGRSGGDSIPLITADTAPYKTAPDTPGGAEIPFQDKLVFNRLDPNGKPVQAEKLLPPPEEPMPAAPAPTAVTKAVTAPPVVATSPAPVAAPIESVASAPVANPAPVAVAPGAAPPANPKTGTVATTTVVSAPVAAAPAPIVATAAEPSPAPMAGVPVAKPMPAVKPTSTSSTASTGNVRIQLASIPDQANAQKALPTLASKYGSALGGAKLSLVKAEIAGKGTYWRVQSQPLDKAVADSICTAVKAQGGVCITAK